jgi:D-glycero-alpha-D-manno-heptose-7-phosphate kinase
VEIAEAACHLEAVEAGIPGGRQDQFAAAHGGFLRLEFRDPDAEVQRLKVEPGFARDLARRMVLCYTSASRFSGTTISRVMQAYEHGEPNVVSALHGIRAVAEKMAEALGAGDTAAVGRLLTENWQHQQALDSRMCTEDMSRLERTMTAAGALGGKAAGSGAGGCMFFLGPDDPARAIEAARAFGAQLLPVQWATRGVHQC